jgi:hypothetical protein
MFFFLPNRAHGFAKKKKKKKKKNKTRQEKRQRRTFRGLDGIYETRNEKLKGSAPTMSSN